MKDSVFLSPWFALITMFLAQLLAAIGNLSVAPLAPFFQDSFNITYVQIGFLTSLLSIGACASSIPSGWIVDRIGINKSLFFFGSVLSASYSLLGVLDSYFFSLLLMLLIGVAYGAMTPITTKSVVQWFHSKNRGFAMSFKQTGVVGGGAVASFLIVYYGSEIGWNFTVILLGISFFLIYFIIALIYRDPPDEKEVNSQEALFFWKNVSILLRNKIFILLCIIMSLFLSCQFSLTTYLILFLKDTLHFSLSWSSIGLSVFLVGGVCGRLFWGWISDHFYNRKREYVIFIIALIGAGSFIALVLFSLYGQTIPNWVVIITLFFSGMNITGWNGVMITIVVEENTIETAGLGSGVSYAIANLGTMLGVPITGFIIENWNYNVALIYLSSVFMLAALAVLSVIHKKRKLPQPY